MIIDFHAHTFPPKIVEAALDKLRKASHVPTWTDGTNTGLVASMEKAGVDLSIVLPVVTNPHQVPKVNDASAALNAAERGRGLHSFGCIHPEYENWHEELGRISRLGLKGIKVHPVYQNVDFDDIRFLRIFERAGELGLIVVTHSGADIGYPGVERCTPTMLRRAVEQVGPFRLVAAHMGGWKEWQEAADQLSHTQICLDTAFSTGSMTPLADGRAHHWDLDLLDEEGFMTMVKAFSPKRILFGTDSPWSGQKESLDWLHALPLPPEDLTAILGGNARRMLDEAQKGRCL